MPGAGRCATARATRPSWPAPRRRTRAAAPRWRRKTHAARSTRRLQRGDGLADRLLVLRDERLREQLEIEGQAVAGAAEVGEQLRLEARRQAHPAGRFQGPAALVPVEGLLVAAELHAEQ